MFVEDCPYAVEAGSTTSQLLHPTSETGTSQQYTTVTGRVLTLLEVMLVVQTDQRVPVTYGLETRQRGIFPRLVPLLITSSP